MTARNVLHNLPAASSARAHALINKELSTAARVGHVALLLGAAAMSAAVGSLWATEPALPLRTQLAFGVMTLIGVAWVTYAAWVLTTRRVLLGRHRVIAGRMAVTFTGVFVLGGLAAAVTSGHPAGYAAAASGAVMQAVAVFQLVRAQREVARLTARRAEIERTLLARSQGR